MFRKTTTQSQIFLFVAAILTFSTGLTEAFGFDYDVANEDDAEGRILFTSGGGISLNNTSLSNVGALLAGLLIAILALLTLGPSLFGLGGGEREACNY